MKTVCLCFKNIAVLFFWHILIIYKIKMEVSTDLHAHILSVFQEEADKIFTASALKVPDNEASREMLARHKKLFMDASLIFLNFLNILF